MSMVDEPPVPDPNVLELPAGAWDGAVDSGALLAHLKAEGLTPIDDGVFAHADGSVTVLIAPEDQTAASAAVAAFVPGPPVTVATLTERVAEATTVDELKAVLADVVSRLPLA